jgi:hypothetical protein
VAAGDQGCRLQAPLTFPVVAIALIFWLCVFLTYFTSAGTTPIDFFLGPFEVPPDLGTWKGTGADAKQGLVREERFLLPQGRANAGYLLRQVRYRDPRTLVIVRIEPEQKLPRRRVGRGRSADT